MAAGRGRPAWPKNSLRLFFSDLIKLQSFYRSLYKQRVMLSHPKRQSKTTLFKPLLRISPTLAQMGNLTVFAKKTYNSHNKSYRY